MFGLSRTSPEIEVEAFAGNLLQDSFRTIPNGPSGYWTNAPAQEIVHTLQNSGFQAVVSYDAGDFVCNSTYCTALNAINSLSLKTLGLFIRLPPAREHLSESQALWNPGWPLESLKKATNLLPHLMAHHARRPSGRQNPRGMAYKKGL